MRKVTAFMLSIVITATSAIAVSYNIFDDDRPINYVELPANSQEFIEEYFSKDDISHIILDKELLGDEYKVVFTNGDKIEFDNKGEWKEISCRYNEVPKSLVPDKIRNYIHKNYPEKKITEIKRKHGNWEAKITGGLELTFNKSYQLIDIDD